MKRFVITAVFLLALAICAFAQEPVPAALPTSAVTYQPQYFLAGGAGFNQYATPQASGFLTFGFRVSDLNFTYTTLTMTSKSSTLGQGFGRYLISQNGFTLAMLGDAGFAAGGGSVGGTFGAGGSIGYDISRWTKVPHTSFIATLKCDKASGDEVKPTFKFGVVLGLGN